MDKNTDKKHYHYFDKYQPNDIFWGIGIENECYLECKNNITVTPEFMLNNWRRERYSVNYYKNYKDGVYLDALKKYLTGKKSVDLPVMLNSHSFINTDKSGNPKTLCNKDTTPNPAFEGKTLIEFLENEDEYFKKEYAHKFIFDGDSIEFVTQNFYKTNISNTIKELIDIKREFIDKINYYFVKNNIHEEVKIATANYPFNVFKTNSGYYTIFNNMTYHFNITLPTKLDEKGNIENMELFTSQHKNLINAIQWIEPFLIAIYGSGDILAGNSKKLLSKGSQRVAISRYIGAGTYDIDKMEKGKVLQIETVVKKGCSWFDKFYDVSGYNKLDKIGLDINFNKFKNHGIEIRFFDYFPEEKLEEVLELLVYLCDFSLDTENHKSYNKIRATTDVHWNHLMYDVIVNGSNTKVSDITGKKLSAVFGIYVSGKIDECYKKIYTAMKIRYSQNGTCSKLFMSNKN
jgi:hypothetical protein